MIAHGVGRVEVSLCYNQRNGPMGYRLMTITQISRITEADLLRLAAQEPRVEVIAGKVVHMTPVGFLHVLIAGNVYRALYDYATQHKLGYVCGDGLIYVLEQDEECGIRETRIPDASFVRKGRLPHTFDQARPFPGAPDLAVEVMSPTDSATELLAKIRAYFRAGTVQVWVLYPEQQELHQYTHDQGAVRVYRDTDMVDTVALFPGMTLVVRDLFALPDMED